MTDEKFTFIEDLREKKKTATGAHHKRTHCGKGGAVKFPSDFMTKKEREAMNGEVKSYRLNDPMSWAEFKAMPDDIRIAYITALRGKYNVSDRQIAGMLGVSQHTMSAETVRLGIKSTKKGREKWDSDGWLAWVNGVKLAQGESTEAIAEPVPVPEEKPIADDDISPFIVEQHRRSIPESGSMTFAGRADDALEAIGVLLGYADVRLHVSWEAIQAEGVCASDG